jgi:hypothetical protein
MSTTSSARRAARRQSQDGSADKVVVNLDASSPVAGSGPGLTVSPGARTSPIDVEALDDEVQAVSPSQVPPPVSCLFKKQSLSYLAQIFLLKEVSTIMHHFWYLYQINLHFAEGDSENKAICDNS